MTGRNARPHGAKRPILSTTYRNSETYIFISFCFIHVPRPALHPSCITNAGALNACYAAQRFATAVPALQG